ncbi:hypothetical protein HYV80_01735 [Candidatus Woesearchaeota archaeon]|nr:hypothetical protein [Candidatus Woesearchaeota archaeon]
MEQKSGSVGCNMTVKQFAKDSSKIRDFRVCSEMGTISGIWALLVLAGVLLTAFIYRIFN